MTLEARPIAFPRFDDEQIAALRRFGTSARFTPGDTLFAEGEVDIPCFVIESGEVAIVERSNGREQIVAVHEPREFTGDVDTLTGRPAIDPSGTPSELARRVTSTAVVPPREINPCVPAAVGEVVCRAMAKDPGGRFPTPAELARELYRLEAEFTPAE